MVGMDRGELYVITRNSLPEMGVRSISSFLYPHPLEKGGLMRTFLVFTLMFAVCQYCGKCGCDGTVSTVNADGSVSVTTCTVYTSTEVIEP